MADKSSRHWYARYVGDIQRKTSHLSLQQMGAYDRLMDWYYANERPIPINRVQMHRICNAVALEEKEDVEWVVQEYFTETPEGWRLKRADEEIAKRAEISEKRRRAQAIKEEKRLKKQGANAPAKAGASAVSNATTTTTTIDSVSNDTESPLTPKGGIVSGGKVQDRLPALVENLTLGMLESFLCPDGTFENFDGLFDRLWAFYPAIRDKGHKGKAKIELRKLLKKGVSHETIIEGVRRYRKYCDDNGEKQPDFFRWLRDEGFNREYPTGAKPPTGNSGHGRNRGYDPDEALRLALSDRAARGITREGGSD